jgi:periplasmic protein TonB
LNKSYNLRVPRNRFPGLLLAVGLHIALIAILWNYRTPVRPPNVGSTIMVTLITSEPEVAKPVVMRVEPEKPKPKPKPRPEKVMISTPTPAPTAFEVAPPPEPEPVAPPPGPKGPPAPIVEPYADPSYLYNEIKYPEALRRAKKQGTVQLRVLVTAQGTVGAIEVSSSSGTAGLDEAALESVKKWKFKPALQGDKPVDYWTIVPIKYHLTKFKG